MTARPARLRHERSPTPLCHATMEAARQALLHELGPMLNPAGRAAVLWAATRKRPVTITINLNAPPSLSLTVEGELQACVTFEQLPGPALPGEEGSAPR
jgi:hypothetical protein